MPRGVDENEVGKFARALALHAGEKKRRTKTAGEKRKKLSRVGVEKKYVIGTYMHARMRTDDARLRL